jgi:hypothetical protein
MKYSRSLVATLLMSGGLVNAVAPVFADVPRASTPIENTATASYDDGTGGTVNTSSNTVKITVAKVAGIVVTPTGFDDITTASAFKPGDDVYATFDVINTGNDGVQFQIPKLATVSTATVTFGQVEYNAGTALSPNWTPVTAAAGTPSQTIAVGGTLKVRVKVTILTNAIKGADITVTLGKTTTPATVIAGVAHIERGVGAGEDVVANDIYTVDVSAVDGTVVKLTGAAANGIRETSAVQTIKVEAIKQAFPSVTLTSGTPIVVNATTDTIPYTVGVSVATTDPTSSGKEAVDLQPTVIKLGTGLSPTTGTDTPRVLVTTAVPTNSNFTSIGTVPTDWTPVYATTVYSTVAATQATTVWSTTAPTNPNDVKQVGFIYTPTGTTATVGKPLPTGSTASFPINVTTTQLGTFDAVSTVIGTNPDATGLLPDPTKPATATVSDAVTTARSVTPTATSIYNGPVNDAEAKGPGGDNNTDFINKSMVISGADATRINGVLPKVTTTSAVIFSNAVKNPTNASTNISLLPTPPANAGDLKLDTVVTIKTSDGLQTRTYTYDGTNFKFTSSNTGINTPITLPSVAPNGGTAGYSVEVLLPGGGVVDQLVGNPVSITAFTGGTLVAGVAGTVVSVPANNTAKNTTIDRVYTGFINLVKEVRALDNVGQQDDASIPYTDSALSVGSVQPGKFIQYRIKAVNVSPAEDSTATGSQILKAQNLNIKEDGVFVAGTNPNNWAANTTHEAGTAKARLGTTVLPISTVKFEQGLKADSDTTISRYDAVFAPEFIAPGQTGSFTFIRKVNAPTP